MWPMNQYTRCCVAICLRHILLASSLSSYPLKKYQWIHSMIDSLLASSSSLFQHSRRIDSLFQFQSFPYYKKWDHHYCCSHYQRNGPVFIVDWSINQRDCPVVLLLHSIFLDLLSFHLTIIGSQNSYYSFLFLLLPPFVTTWHDSSAVPLVLQKPVVVVVVVVMDRSTWLCYGTTRSSPLPGIIINRRIKIQLFSSYPCWLASSSCFLHCSCYSLIIYRHTVSKHWSSLLLEAVWRWFRRQIPTIRTCVINKLYWNKFNQRVLLIVNLDVLKPYRVKK